MTTPARWGVDDALNHLPPVAGGTDGVVHLPVTGVHGAVRKADFVDTV